jgi:hypothetical protein
MNREQYEPVFSDIPKVAGIKRYPIRIAAAEIREVKQEPAA